MNINCQHPTRSQVGVNIKNDYSVDVKGGKTWKMGCSVCRGRQYKAEGVDRVRGEAVMARGET